MKYQYLLFILVFLVFSCKQEATDIPSRDVFPSENQLAYQQMEMVGFIHFTVNTFTDKEWGYGDEDPAIFNPTELNVEDWVLTAKSAGLKELILTAKHHDGFCLWPSKYTEHSVKNSPYKNGEGDIVREFVDACQEYGIKAGLYLSPWDRNHKDYGSPEYITYYRNQLKELLSEYGEINEIWFDGANGGEGYYGGAYENRKIDKKTYYDWDSTIALVKSLQPNIMIFSDAGPDIRWVGNENGHAGETFWSTISDSGLVIGGADTRYLNTGDPDGNKWIIGQCDVSIRPGWFYHESQDSLVKKPEEIMDIYYKSVGRNGVLLLNLPPDKRGRIHENDILSLRRFKYIRTKTFKDDLTENAKIQASSIRQNQDRFSPQNLLDDNIETYWAPKKNDKNSELLIEFDTTVYVRVIKIQEAIRFGQKISKFKVLVEDKEGNWNMVGEGTTIGYKRLIRIYKDAVKLKLIIEDSYGIPGICEIGVY
ncbi:alpha-L-fucosidase [Bacteroidota bacterium]